MFRNNAYTFKNFPVEEKQRKWTDCFCTICTAIFALSLFILSFIMFHRRNFWETNYPVEDSGKVCNYDLQSTPFIYFSNPNDMSSGRYCVSECPGYREPIQCASEQAAQCIGLGGSQYETEGVINRLGAFCIAADDTVAEHMWNSPEIAVKNSLLNSFDVILLALLIGLCIGIIYLVLTMFIPDKVVYLAFIGAFIALLFSGIYVLARPVRFFSPNGWNIVFGIVLIIVALCFIIYMVCFKKELKLSGLFMQHAAKFLKETPIVFAYIPLFLVLTFGLIVLIIWQYVAFGTQYEPYYQEGDLYKSSSHNVALQVFNIIELIWGLQFLRDAFNFVVSGNAIEWYFRNQDNNFKSHCCHPFTRLLCKNWGSVAGGSFLNAFFNLFDLVSDMFKCDSKGKCSKCSSCYKVCCCCDYIFELVRTDAYAYINLSGIPYCNAARQCEALCQYSQIFRGSQSCIRLYRIAAHIFQVCIVAIICYFILAARSSYTNVYILILIIFAAYCIVTYFIDIVADGAEGLMVCYLAEQNLDGENMEICPPNLREDMYHYYYKNHR